MFRSRSLCLVRGKTARASSNPKTDSAGPLSGLSEESGRSSKIMSAYNFFLLDYFFSSFSESRSLGGARA